MPLPALPDDLKAVVALALEEDVGSGDLTAELIPEGSMASASVVCRETAVLCGCAWFEAVFAQLDANIAIAWSAGDGEILEPDQEICRLQGPARALLTGERSALNFLQVLSGTASAARSYADAVAGTGCRVLDTRKTIPGLRSAQKYAVACGGASNHRRGLYDAILVKENHIIAAGGIEVALRLARELRPGFSVEIEVESLAELEQALDASADIVLLDNFDLPALRQAVALRRARPGCQTRLEASGNVQLETAREIASTGVDFISVGAITKHLRAVDFSMRFRLAAPPAP